jgi:hypothetical protein
MRKRPTKLHGSIDPRAPFADSILREQACVCRWRVTHRNGTAGAGLCDGGGLFITQSRPEVETSAQIVYIF